MFQPSPGEANEKRRSLPFPLPLASAPYPQHPRHTGGQGRVEAGQHRADDGGEQHVDGGERPQHRSETQAQARNQDAEFAPGDQGGARAKAAPALDPGLRGAVPADQKFGHGSHEGQQRGRQQHVRHRRQVELQAEKEEKHGGEQVAQRLDLRPRPVRDLARERDADEEGADGRADLEQVGGARHHQHQPQHAEQQRFVAGHVEHAAQHVAVTHGEKKGHPERRQRQREVDPHREQAAADEQRRHDGQVKRHHHVLDDAHGENGRRFTVAQATQVREDFGGDAAGGEVGDAPEQHPGERRQTEQRPGHHPRREVEREVEQPDAAVGPQVGAQFVAGVFQPQDKQQQNGADFRPGVDELLGGVVEVHDGAQADARHQVQRNRGDAQPPGGAAHQRQREDDRAEFQKQAA